MAVVKDQIAELLLSVAEFCDRVALLVHEWAKSFIEADSPNVIGELGEGLLDIFKGVVEFFGSLI